MIHSLERLVKRLLRHLGLLRPPQRRSPCVYPPAWYYRPNIN